ncbi:gamma-butyrobetaine hydroxylase-like domain-containing protein [Pseudomonas sp. LS-2]|jgi:DUF971 family protein|uniref:DUF971 domain-containing protein n=1 Tax=Pseudomonas sp. LS-2 TaxID=2315859 RepID=UPI000E76AE17|nr:gamma-butyrobetaine hydroxylase-like domain-containing protein [Pseudomonas sp. LS-2]RJX78463.1 DUF971 domain-containing protein [Pseudomonas sp. LS-2]
MMAAPRSIGNSRDRQLLRLSWQDGSEQHIGHVQLRQLCPCSQCRAFRLRGMKPVVADSIRLLEVHAQGYGLQLVFSDGHQRGIYPWAYLAQLGAERTGNRPDTPRQVRCHS